MQKRKCWQTNSVEIRLHFATPHVDGFENWLRDLGYIASTIEERVRQLAGWTHWMHIAGFSLDTVMDGITAASAAFKGKKSARAYATADRLFIRYLQEQGIFPRPASPSPSAEKWPILGAFRNWARQHLGITNAELLRASQIVPWAECDTDEKRLDVHNGLLLSVLWDAAFDAGLVSFADDGTAIASPRLTTDAAIALGLNKANKLTGLTGRTGRTWHGTVRAMDF